MGQTDGFFPAGLRILVVDDEPLCLMILERMLLQCKYNVTTCNRATKALSLLRENMNYFDLVISDVYMPDMDGFKLLEAIGLELDLPVIMMSADGETDLVMKGITHGACDYLLKPVRIEELRNVWQHVVRKRVLPREPPKEEGSGDWDVTNTKLLDSPTETEHSLKKRKERVDDLTQTAEDSSSLKKARVVWSVELHKQFVQAVNQLGIDIAVPKRIQEIMNVQGLTRENIASHLQKYRLYLKRLSGVNPQPYPVASFYASEDGNSGGKMQILPGRQAPPSAASSKGPNIWSGVNSNIGHGLTVAHSLTSNQGEPVSRLALEQLLQQKQPPLNSRGGAHAGVNHASLNVSSSDLQRMDSRELDQLMKTQYDAIRQRSVITNDISVLGNLAVLENLDSLQGLVGPRGVNISVPMSNLGNLRANDSLAGMAAFRGRRDRDMGNLELHRAANSMTMQGGYRKARPGDDLGLVSVGSAGELSAPSPFSSVNSFSNGGLSGSSFNEYNEFAGTSDFLTPPPPDLSLC